MCGIAAAINLKGKSVKEQIVYAFEDQKNRGTEGFGIAYLDNTKIKVKRATEINKFLIDLHFLESPLMMIHHRIPTSTENKISQTHPIVVDNPSLDYKYLVVHNGVISNAEEIKTKHNKEGFVYTTQIVPAATAYYKKTFNDSEAIAVSLAKIIDDKKDCNKPLHIDCMGSAAFIVLKLDKKTDEPLAMYWGRNESNPLTVKFDKSSLMLSSLGSNPTVEPNFLFETDTSSKELKVLATPLTFAKTVVSSAPFSSDYRSEAWYKERRWDDKTNTWVLKEAPKALPVAKEEPEEFEDWGEVVEDKTTMDDIIQDTYDLVTRELDDYFLTITDKDCIDYYKPEDFLPNIRKIMQDAQDLIKERMEKYDDIPV